MIVNQWVPAAHTGDAIGDSARRVRDLLRGLGHESEIYALTIDDDLRDEVRPFGDPAARRGDVTIFHYALPSPMTDGVRVARRAGACCSTTTSRRRASSRRTTRRCSGSRRWRGRSWRRWSATSIWRSACPSTTAASSRRSASRRPASAARRRHVAHHAARRAGPALERMLDDELVNFLFVGRIAPNKQIEDHIRLAEHYKRYVDAYYRFIFVGRYDAVPRYYATIRALISRVSRCSTNDSSSPARCPTRSWPSTTATRPSTCR